MTTNDPMPTTPPPGKPGYYYSDKQGGAMKWWDGYGWTEYTQPQPLQPGQQPLPPQTAIQTTAAANDDKPAAPQVYVPAKNPGVAVLLSFFLPGAGSLYASSVLGGVVLLICWFVSWVSLLVGLNPLPLIVWVGGMASAYGAANKFNARYGIGTPHRRLKRW